VGDAAEEHPKRRIDWTAINLAASIALPATAFFHVGHQILSRALPGPVPTGVSVATLYIAEYALNYGIPFAVALLVIRVLDLAAPLRAAPIVAWILFLCSIVIHAAFMSESVALQVLVPYEAWDLTYFASFFQVPLPVRQALMLGLAGSWLWVASGFVGALVRGRATLQWPTGPDVAVALVAGVAVPALAFAPFVPVIINYRELYAAQETRFRELCKSVKAENFAEANGPKSVFFDPNESLSCWDVRDGQCAWLSLGDRVAQYSIINWQLEFVEFWENAGHAKAPVLKRCYVGNNCPTIGAVTAKYRAVTREIRSKADEAMDLHQRVVTVDERETGKIVGKLQFVYSTQTHRFCAPPTEIRRTRHAHEFDSSEFVVRALGLVPRKQPGR